MADMTLCASDDCPVRERCRRNQACPDAYVWSEYRQSFAYWHPEAGAGCPGFIEGRAALEPHNDH
jgi:hypothetical protein